MPIRSSNINLLRWRDLEHAGLVGAWRRKGQLNGSAGAFERLQSLYAYRVDHLRYKLLQFGSSQHVICRIVVDAVDGLLKTLIARGIPGELVARPSRETLQLSFVLQVRLTEAAGAARNVSQAGAERVSLWQLLNDWPALYLVEGQGDGLTTRAEAIS